MKTPIIVFEHDSHDIQIYDTVDKAKSSMEPIDVIDNNYSVYDSDGSIMTLKIEKELRKGKWGIDDFYVEHTQIHHKENAPIKSKEVSSYIKNYLEILKEPFCASDDLPKLINIYVKRCGFSKNQ